MNKLKKIGLFFSIGTLAITTGFVIKSFAIGDESGFTPQQKMTPAQTQQLHQSVTKIYTPYGIFKRVPPGTQTANSNVAHGENSINSSTKVLITKEGTFVKQSE
jgi:hypothetical protein